jgi:transcriptional regulator GlxA family with amidase domain
VDSVGEVVTDVQKEADRRKLARRRGRPAIEIAEDQLAMLIEHRFSLADIARMMNVSARTIRRRVLQYGLESSHCIFSPN